MIQTATNLNAKKSSLGWSCWHKVLSLKARSLEFAARLVISANKRECGGVGCRAALAGLGSRQPVSWLELLVEMLSSTVAESTAVSMPIVEKGRPSKIALGRVILVKDTATQGKISTWYE